jgi:hypothetical protein
MANIRKSFNFRNGVQVDDDNFIVNANGLVGIGTSIPTEFLDVHGTAKVTGLVTATNLTITGVSTFYSDLKVGSAITFNSSTGIVSATAFYGDGSTLSNIVGFSTNAWILNIAQTGLSTSLNIGIGTQALDAYDLVIGSDPLVSEGISFDGSSGNVYSSGIVTAASRFSGNLTGNVTGNINSTGVSTFATLLVGTGVTISGGIVTATSFVGSLTGTATTATNIPNLTGAITSNNTTTSLGSFTSSQLAAALTDETGSGANVFATSPTLITPVLGSATATSIVVGSGVTINSGGITASAGIITAFGFSGTLTGNVVGIASTARDLTSNARVNIADIQSQTSSIGVSTVFTRLYAESIGVGTNSLSSDIHIRRSSTSTLQVTSDTAEAIVAVGRSTTLTGNNGALRFGNTSGVYPYSNSRTLDVINYGTGNLNHYLNYSAGSGNIGDFNWIYAPDATNPLMTLTYGGNLGLGITVPTNTLHVVGTSTITGNAFFGQNLDVVGNTNISGTLNLTEDLTSNLTGNVTGNVNSTIGFSTFYDISVTNNVSSFKSFIGIGTAGSDPSYHFQVLDQFFVSSSGIGIGTNIEIPIIDSNFTISASDADAVFKSVGIGTTVSQSALTVVGGAIISGVTTSLGGFTSGLYENPVKITVSGSILTFTVPGVGTTSLTLF